MNSISTFSLDSNILKGFSILVAEDNVELAGLYATALQRAGAQVRKVHNGKEALKQWKEDTVDLVLMDYELPNKSGLEVALSLKESGYNGQVVFLTGQHFRDYKDACEEHGFEVFLYKPVSIPDLIHIVSASLNAL